MKRTFTITLSLLFSFALTSNAGTPTIDGTFDGIGVWGPAVSTADGTAGWGGANAKTLYVTSDADYYYFGAELSAAKWMRWTFIINTQAGGASTDAWGYQVNYNHTDKPDITLKGNFGEGGKYAEIDSWNGSAWTGWAGLAWSEFAETIYNPDWNVVNGFVEIRVPRSYFPGLTSGGVQFYITGDNTSQHGSFDAVPNDNNTTDWNAPASLTILNNYANGIILPVVLKQFDGILKNNTVTLNWATASENNLSRFEIEQSVDGSNWTKAGIVAGANNPNGTSYNFTINNFIGKFNMYRLRIVDRNGKFDLSGQVTIKAKGDKSIELLGSISTNVIRVAMHNETAATYQTELFGMDGKRISTGIHSQAGGSGVINVPVPLHAAKGIYFLKVSHNGELEVLKVMVQ